MPTPSRDRLARPVDISTLYRGAARRVDLIVDEPGLIWTGLSGNGPRNVSSGGSDSSGRSIGVYGGRFGRGRNLYRPLMSGRENRTPGMMARRSGGSRGRGSRLPSWYPRTPLRDITAIVRVMNLINESNILVQVEFVLIDCVLLMFMTCGFEWRFWYMNVGYFWFCSYLVRLDLIRLYKL